MTKVIVALFGLILLTGCPPKVQISTVHDPLWMEADEAVPYEGWLVTQGWMSEVIENTGK